MDADTAVHDHPPYSRFHSSQSRHWGLYSRRYITAMSIHIPTAHPPKSDSITNDDHVSCPLYLNEALVVSALLSSPLCYCIHNPHNPICAPTLLCISLWQAGSFGSCFYPGHSPGQSPSGQCVLYDVELQCFPRIMKLLSRESQVSKSRIGLGSTCVASLHLIHLTTELLWMFPMSWKMKLLF